MITIERLLEIEANGDEITLDETEKLASELLDRRNPAPCVWTKDSDVEGQWNTTCGADTFVKPKFAKYCSYCGHPIEAKEQVAPEVVEYYRSLIDSGVTKVVDGVIAGVINWEGEVGRTWAGSDKSWRKITAAEYEAAKAKAGKVDAVPVLRNWMCPVCFHCMTEQESKGYAGCPTGIHPAKHINLSEQKFGFLQDVPKPPPPAPDPFDRAIATEEYLHDDGGAKPQAAGEGEIVKELIRLLDKTADAFLVLVGRMDAIKDAVNKLRAKQ